MGLMDPCFKAFSISKLGKHWPNYVSKKNNAFYFLTVSGQIFIFSLMKCVEFFFFLWVCFYLSFENPSLFRVLELYDCDSFCDRLLKTLFTHYFGVWCERRFCVAADNALEKSMFTYASSGLFLHPIGSCGKKDNGMLRW